MNDKKRWLYDNTLDVANVSLNWNRNTSSIDFLSKNFREGIMVKFKESYSQEFKIIAIAYNLDRLKTRL